MNQRKLAELFLLSMIVLIDLVSHWIKVGDDA